METAPFKSIQRRDADALKLMADVLAAALIPLKTSTMTQDGATVRTRLNNGLEVEVAFRLTRQGWKVCGGLDGLAELVRQKPMLTSPEEAFETLASAHRSGDAAQHAACSVTPETASPVVVEALAQGRLHLGEAHSTNDPRTRRYTCTLDGTLDFVHSEGGWKVAGMHLPGGKYA